MRKDIFKLSGGFNDSIQLGENVDLLIRVKKICTIKSKKFLHFTEPITCSLRRFNESGYFSVLLKWFMAYIGFWKQSYKTMEELRQINKDIYHD